MTPLGLPDPGKWDDLTVRFVSGFALGTVGVVAIIAGGVWFQMLAVFVTAVMIWELWMMIEPTEPTPGMLLAALVASVLSGLLANERELIFVFVLIAPVVGGLILRRERRTFLLFALGIQLAGWGLVVFRADYGMVWLLWLVLVVSATDVFGYFVGRTVGGPKFWPKVSPKKTWSGTAGGWVAAAAVGAVFAILTDTAWSLLLISALLSFASQLGDIAESALKRRMKVKDSSTLIPGHGGLFDRFDGLLGASLFMLAIAFWFDVPGVDF